jgi:isopentenyl diphosphate isomerase/L-lactate dehydrogenase-like FMN-dependent dehydrogenase
VNSQLLFQMYWSGGRDVMVQRLERAKAAGAKGIILTLDWTFSNGRDWGSPWIPEKLDLKTMIKLSPQALSKPKWLFAYLKTGKLPDLSAPNMAHPGQKPPAFFGAYYEWMQMPPPSWEDIAWLRAQWDGPFVVKGVCRVDDAKRVRDLGATGLSVSNHGGNNLDGTPSPIRVLPAIAGAVGNEIDVVLDGGIRRGSDVVKAVAMGAKAVMIGRAYLWGLAANGQAGVENVLDILHGGIDSCLLGLGKSHISELTPDDVIAPRDFFVTLGDK